MEGRDERQLIGSKRAWQAGDTSYDAGPSRFQDSKKARKEKENEFFLWGMRNPDLAVKKMHMARTVGADISRAWNHFLDRHSQGKEIAEAYSGRQIQGWAPSGREPWRRSQGEGLRGCRDEGGVRV